MSNFSLNSYPVPRSINQHPLWISARPLWKLVYFWILEHAIYKQELSYDVNGRTITLKKGQCCYTLRQISEDLKISKNEVEGAIKHFLGISRRGKARLSVTSGQAQVLLRQQIRQQIRHEKSIVDILCEGYCEINQTTNQTINQTGNQTTVRQQSDINNKEKREKKEESNDSSLSNGAGSAGPTLVTRRFFSLNKKTLEFEGISEKDIQGWQEHYKFLNPLDYLEEMAQWLIKNKDDRYLQNIPRKFFTNWLAKHNQINQLNTHKGKANDNRRVSEQWSSNDDKGEFIGGKLIAGSKVAGAGFYDNISFMS